MVRRRHRKTLGKVVGRAVRKAISGNQVYILQLRDSCYYVGYTHDIRQRIRQHKRKKGSSWTTLHRPVKLVWHQKFNSQDEAYKIEHILTRYYACLYGNDRVRGSVWVGIRNQPPTYLNYNEKSLLVKLGFDINYISNSTPNRAHYQKSYSSLQISNKVDTSQDIRQKDISDINYCYSCGTELDGRPSYCYNCGVKIR